MLFSLDDPWETTISCETKVEIFNLQKINMGGSSFYFQYILKFVNIIYVFGFLKRKNIFIKKIYAFFPLLEKKRREKKRTKKSEVHLLTRCYNK